VFNDDTRPLCTVMITLMFAVAVISMVGS